MHDREEKSEYYMFAESFRVLLIEDNPGDARLVEEMLKADRTGYFKLAVCADRLSTGLELIDAGDIDIVLLDLNLPDSVASETFLRVHSHAPHLPVIVLSGLDNEGLALKTVHEGSQDYLVKGHFDRHLLSRAMRYAIERTRAEQALARESELLLALMENIPDRIYFKDRASCFIRINRAMADSFGLKSPEEAIGKSDFDFYSEEHARPAFDDEQRVLATGQPMIAKVEKETFWDGRIGWGSTTKMPLRNKHGGIVGTFGITRDITDLKRMEDAVAAERNLLRSVINNLPDHIFVKNTAGLYILDNLPHRRFLGMQRESEIVGKSAFDVFPPDTAQRVHDADQAIIESGESLLDQEEPVVDLDGNSRWFLSTKVPLKDESDKILGLVCIGRDVTAQKIADEKLKKANTELLAALDDLKQAHEMLRETQLQLIEAEKMRSIGRLAAGVAHEVKNPLAIITMGIHYLTQQKFTDDSNVPQILKDIEDAVRRADAVVRGLLDFSVPKTLEVSEENLNEIIEHALLLVRGEMKGEKFRVVKELQVDLPLLRLDYLKIGQVFVNVFTNAIHAMGEGGTLTVRTFARQLAGVGGNIGDSRWEAFRVGDTIVSAEVEDTGVGVPEDKISKVFDPFFTTKSTGKGTGLGLSVARSIINLHGGIIEIRNRPDKGVKVTIMFKV